MIEFKALSKTEEFQHLLDSSEDGAKLILKTSPICSISSFVEMNLKSGLDPAHLPLDIFQVDVVNNRPLSQEIEQTLNLVHASPQIILVYKSKVLWHTSHGGITAEAILEAIDKFVPKI